jgi:hypothetical protein
MKRHFMMNLTVVVLITFGILGLPADGQSLAEHVDNVGLNVKADNAAAVAMYRRLGFEVVGSYYELMVLSHPWRS